MKRFLILLLAVGMLLSCLGCSGETLQETQGTEQTVETEMPQDTEQPSDTGTQNSATQATLSADDPQWAEILAGPLTKDADYCGESSGYTMAETEDGYYLLIGFRLCYADKSDLSAWYPVCSDATCDHTNSLTCASFIQTLGFYLQDGRIHFINSESNYTKLSSHKEAVYSMGPDGSDLQEDFCFDTALTEDYNSASVCIAEEYAYGCFGKINADGTWTYQILRASQSGTEIVGEMTLDEEEQIRVDNTSIGFAIAGRFGIKSAVLSSDDNTAFFPTEDGGMDILTGGENLHLRGACVLKDTIYHYEPGEGFYRSDLDGGNTVLITENQMEDGYGFCVTERLYLETNVNHRTEMEDEPALMLFDGENWYDLTLPEDFRTHETMTVYPISVSSERLFLYTYDNSTKTYRLYSVDLSQNPYALEMNVNADDPYFFRS